MIKAIIKMLLISIFISFSTIIAKNIDRTNYNDPVKLYHKISDNFLDAKINLVQVIDLSGLFEKKQPVKAKATTENFGKIFKDEQVQNNKYIAEEIIAERLQQENKNNHEIGQIFKANSNNRNEITGKIFKDELDPKDQEDLSNNSLKDMINEKNLKKNFQIAKESLANVEKHIAAINNNLGSNTSGQNAMHNENNGSLISLLEQLGNQGSDSAQFILGMLYQYGFLVQQNKNKAIEWYKKAALKGSTRAKEKIDYLNGSNIKDTAF